jgi:hypothetical protein
MRPDTRLNQIPAQDEKSNMLKRPDVVLVKDKFEVYELKPVSCETGYKNTRAVAQLEGYINTLINSLLNTTKEGDSLPGEFTVPFDKAGLGDNAYLAFSQDKDHPGLYY